MEQKTEKGPATDPTQIDPTDERTASRVVRKMSIKKTSSMADMKQKLNDTAAGLISSSNEAMVGKSGMLHEAAEHGNDKLVERYVVNNPDNTESEMIMLSCDNEKRNALHKAAVNGHSKCVELLLKHSTVLQNHIDKKDRFGCTALYLACVKNTIVLDNGSFATLEEVVKIKLQIVKLLLDNGAKPRYAWKKGRGTALHWCAVHGYDTVAQALLSHVDNKGDRGGQTLLYLVDNNGDLPIDVAGNEVLRRRYRFEEQMVKLEEDPDNNLQKNNRERRELAPVTRYNKETRLKYQTVKQRQPSTKLEGILMRYEACAVALMTTVQVDVKKTDYRLRWLQSMLVWCSYLGLYIEVQEILLIGRNPKIYLSLTWGGISTQSGRTALHYAALMGQDDIIKLLWKFYNDPSQKSKFVSQKDMQKRGCCGDTKSGKRMGFVNYPDHFDNTPLHLCAKQTHYPNKFGANNTTAEMLLKYGADATLLNSEGRAPASYARTNELRQLFEQLTQKQKGFKGSCFDSPRVKNETVLSFDWVIRFTLFKNKARSKDSKHHQEEMKNYLKSKRCLVKLMDDPKKEYTLLMFTATEAVCRHHAGKLKLELPVTHQRVDRAYDPSLEFIFEPIRSRERINILKAVLDQEYELDVFVHSGVVFDYFPLHENTEIESVKSRWTRGCCPEPFRTVDDLINENRSSVMSGLSTIAGYFGEEKAMYFAFVSFYSLYMCFFLMPAGLLVSAAQFYNMAVAGEISASSVHNIYVPVFAVFISIWATVTVEFWKRKQSELAFRWDTAEVVVEEKFRPDYWGAEKFDPVTLTVMKDFPEKARKKRRWAGYLVVLAMVLVVVAIFIFVRWIKRDYIMQNEAPPNDTYWKALAGVLQGIVIAVMNAVYKEVAEWLTASENHPTQTKHDNALIFKIFLFQFINGNMALMSAAFLDKEPVTLWTLLITLMVGNQFVASVQNQLLPRLQYQWEYAMTKAGIAKNFASTHFDDARGAMHEAGHRASSSLTAVMPVTSTIETKSSHSDTDQPRKKKATRGKRNSIFGKPIGEETQEEKDEVEKLDQLNATIIDAEKELGQSNLKEIFKAKNLLPQEGSKTEALRNCSMCDDDLLIDHYAEMILQFTYVVLWSSVFPLTPLIAVLLNFVQIRFEITQLCYYTKRPMPKKEEGIGAWMTIIEIISLIGVVTNSAMIIMTFKAREEFARYLNASNVQSVGEYIGGSSSNSYTGGSGSTGNVIRNTISNSSVFNMQPVDYLSSEVNFLWLMVAVEHAVIVLKLVLREYIEDVPHWVAEAEIAEQADEDRVAEIEAKMVVEEQNELLEKQANQIEKLKRESVLFRESVAHADVEKEINSITQNSESARLKKISLQKQMEEKADQRVQQRLKLRTLAKQTNSLHESRVFRSISAESCESIIDACLYEKWDANTVIFSEGDACTKMYLLMSGSCDCNVGGVHIAGIESVSVFGEYGVIGEKSTTRSATIVAHTKIECLALDRTAFDALKKEGKITAECVEILLEIAAERAAKNKRLLQKKK